VGRAFQQCADHQVLEPGNADAAREQGIWVDQFLRDAAALCAGGGILGLLVTLPQLSILQDNSALPFPEAGAVAEVIRLGDRGNSQEGPREVAKFASAAGAAALFAGLGAARLIASGCAIGLRIGQATSALGLSFSPGLIGAGYLSGSATGGAILVGILIAWGVAVPLLGSMHPSNAGAFAQASIVWSQDVRLIGAGIMAVAALWTMCRFIARTLFSYRPASRLTATYAIGGSAESRRDRSLEQIAVDWKRSAFPEARESARKQRAGACSVMLNNAAAAAGAITAAFVLLAATFAFADEHWSPMVLVVLAAAAVGAGILLSGPCGHIAGLIGTSSSPISSIGMLGLMAISVLAVGLGQSNGIGHKEVLALSLFFASAIMAMAALSNGAFEGFKTVQLVGIPISGQVLPLSLGILVSAAVTPLILELLYQAYGFAGDSSSLNGNATALAAPQATLMTVIARSVVGGLAHTRALEAGGLLGVALILVEFGLTRMRARVRLPAIAVGFGIYLPLGTAMALVVGAALSFAAESFLARKARKRGAAILDQQRRAAVLSACGLLVGESLAGIAAAVVAVVAGSNNDASPMAGWQIALGLVGIGLQCVLLMGWKVRLRPPRLSSLLAQGNG
jgi:OPT family oligopeptide transporter